MLVKKKNDNTSRFRVDCRRLDNLIKRYVYSLPRIDDTLDRLTDAKYFSCMGIKSGYWQIEVDERDREKTAFVTPDGLYEFNVMPFRLCSAPSTFQRVMDTVLAELKRQAFPAYPEDVAVFAANFDDPLRRLEAVLRAIKTFRLSLKPEKFCFAYEELKFLDNVVNIAGVGRDPDKTAEVAKLQQPSDKTAVRRFLGLSALRRRFVKNFRRWSNR